MPDLRGDIRHSGTRCRRQQGPRSVDGPLGIVAARNKVDAVERLDEFANFEGCPIRELPELMLLLDMDDEGAFTLEHVGEANLVRVAWLASRVSC